MFDVDAGKVKDEVRESFADSLAWLPLSFLFFWAALHFTAAVDRLPGVPSHPSCRVSDENANQSPVYLVGVDVCFI